MKRTILSKLPQDYWPWLEDLKSKIRSAQIKAALSVNAELIRLYFEMGAMLHEKLAAAGWGGRGEQIVDRFKGRVPRYGWVWANQFVLHAAIFSLLSK